jgi:hypothetical protein
VLLLVVCVCLLSGVLAILGWQLSIHSVDAEGDDSGEQTEEETQAFRNRDDRLVDIGSLVPGFGGMYIDPANPGVLNVFMLNVDDEEQLAKVERAIDAEFPDAIPLGGIVVVQGQYSIGQLKVWYDDVRAALARSRLAGNGLVGTDLEEDKNRLEVAVDSEELIPQIEELAAEAGVPSGVVRVTVRSRFRFLSAEPDAQTVRSRIRPVIGGVQTQGR